MDISDYPSLTGVKVHECSYMLEGQVGQLIYARTLSVYQISEITVQAVYHTAPGVPY